MENNTGYSAVSALRDAALARVDMARKSLFTPGDYVVVAVIAGAVALQGASQLADGAWTYVLLGLSMVILAPVLGYVMWRASRAGVTSRSSALTATSRGPIVLLMLGVLVVVAALPVRDIFDLTRWLPVYAVLVSILCLAAGTWWMSRIARRELAAAQRELDDAERDLARLSVS